MRRLLILSICFSFILEVTAQTGVIIGRVSDITGENISFAKVSLVDSMGISVGKSITANLDGNYLIKPLLPGKYNVKYSATGCLPQTEKGILVSADKSTFLNVRLKFDPDYTPKKKKGRK